MRLTPHQKQAILDALDFPMGWLGCDSRTAAALVRKGLAHYEGPHFSSDPAPGMDSAYLNEDVLELLRTAREFIEAGLLRLDSEGRLVVNE